MIFGVKILLRLFTMGSHTTLKKQKYGVFSDKSILWIYSKQSVLSGNPKTGGSKTITTYYFSKGGDGEIQELTLLNLKTAFPENHKLHNAIDSQFKSDASLDEYDQFHMHYKINHFLESFEVK